MAASERAESPDRGSASRRRRRDDDDDMSVSSGPSTRRNRSRSRSPWSRSPSSARRPSPPPTRSTDHGRRGSGWGEGGPGGSVSRRDSTRMREYDDLDARGGRDRAGSGSRGGGGWVGSNRAPFSRSDHGSGGDGGRFYGHDGRRDRDYDERVSPPRRSRSPAPPIRSRGERDSGWSRDGERRNGGHSSAHGVDRGRGATAADQGWGARGGPQSRKDSGHSNGRYDDRDRDRRRGPTHGSSRPPLPPPLPRDPYAVSGRDIDDAVEAGRAVVIEGLTRSTLKLHLNKIFTAYGDIRGIDLPVCQTSGQPRGTAVLVYTSSRAAAKAVSYMNTGLIDGQPVDVKVADPQREDTRSRR